MVELKNKKILVVGLARSGLAAARFLLDRGARVTINDCLAAEALGSSVDAARHMGCIVELGDHPMELFSGSDLIVLSPGVPLDIPPLKLAEGKGIPIIGELELASRFVRLPMIAISGTNGKTTTTELVGDILRRSGKRVFVGGNIGNPLIRLVQEEEAHEVAVVEVSSFQLDSARTFHPQVAVLLNITEDHLDRYDSFDSYVRSKCHLFANQTEDDIAVVPIHHPLINSRCTIPARPLRFGRVNPSADAHLAGQSLVCRTPAGEVEHYDLGQWQLQGNHNLENLLAAVLAATCMGAEHRAVQESINDAKPLPHRLEPVHLWRGISFYDDSKATNADSVLRSLESFTSPIVLIAGGRHKEGSFGSLRTLVGQRVKMLVLFGEARFHLAKDLGHLSHTVVVKDLEAAVPVAIGAADPGDVVLLSPACASFDLYEDYRARGQHFRSLVHSLTAAEPLDSNSCAWVAR
jgi:UDP-N-acetylmuramoylalanine--D-glutamate ligase